MKRLLIVNADDFGLNDAATQGILEAHQAGSVTSTTLMVNAPATEQAAELAMANPDLGVGLHFNLTWGHPVSPAATVPTLVDTSGLFYNRKALAIRLLLGFVKRNDVERELLAQYSRMLGLGISPTHADSHQHIHGFGIVFDAMAALCTKHGLPIRVPWVGAEEGKSRPERRMRRALLNMMLNNSTRRWNGRVTWNDSLGSVFDLAGDRSVLADQHYTTLLKRASGRVFELMVHPVICADAMQGYTSIGQVSEAEYRYLLQGSLPRIAHQLGFELGHYGHLRT